MKNSELTEELEEQNAVLVGEVDGLKGSLGEEKKYRVMWRRNCQQLIEYDDVITAKEEEIKVLRARIDGLLADSDRDRRHGAKVTGGRTPVKKPIVPSEASSLGHPTAGISCG